MPGGEHTTRVDVLEARVDGLVKLFEERFKHIDRQLKDLASSVQWMQRTMIGLLVTVAGAAVLLYVKG